MRTTLNNRSEIIKKLKTPVEEQDSFSILNRDVNWNRFQVLQIYFTPFRGPSRWNHWPSPFIWLNKFYKSFSIIYLFAKYKDSATIEEVFRCCRKIAQIVLASKNFQKKQRWVFVKINLPPTWSRSPLKAISAI